MSGVNKNIVILISGSGSNMAAIVQASRRQHWEERHGARVVAVLCNKPDAPGLSLARELGLATTALDHRGYPNREAFDAALIAAIDRHAPTLVVLAGFMRILTSGFVAHYAGRLINIHPSLLPAFTGLHTHQRAIDAGCRFAERCRTADDHCRAEQPPMTQSTDDHAYACWHPVETPVELARGR